MPGRSLQLWVVWLLARQLTGVCDCGLVRVENTECCLLECFSLPTGRHLWHVYSGQGKVRFCDFHPKIVGAMRPGPQFSPLVVLRERWLWCPLCHWSLPRQAGRQASCAPTLSPVVVWLCFCKARIHSLSALCTLWLARAPNSLLIVPSRLGRAELGTQEEQSVGPPRVLGNWCIVCVSCPVLGESGHSCADNALGEAGAWTPAWQQLGELVSSACGSSLTLVA